VAGSLPTGTVTFLFTDVEGSTRLLEDIGAARYAEALAEHRHVVRDALAEHDGVEVDTQGDAFFCAFASARAAAACAQCAQERLEAGALRVRMGLHTGEALVGDGRYVGMDVHRGARIAACGHGGQIVVSSATAALLDPESFPLRDLGEHRLKDLSASQRLYQLGEADFPPLKTLHRTNLPVPATPFVGRRRELESVADRVRDPGTRLVTLTGPGGTGKTRLALQVSAELADGFPGGVFWAPLAPLRERGLVASAIAGALGVDEADEASLGSALVHAVQRPTLLLVDNCEHLLEEVAAAVGDLIANVGGLRLLATSREALALTGERVLPIDPLERPDAVALFIARAEAAGAATLDEQAVGLLCARLDDLPLALEIAAARAQALPPEVLLERLSQRLTLLRGARDAEERQQTLQATIAWSYELLTPEEQAVLRRVSLFAGGGDLDALEHVADADLEELASLVSKSLVRVAHTADGPRYWMLETIREFAGELLAQTDEADERRRRYVRWFGQVATDAWPHLGEPDAARWLERLERDLGNLRVAFVLALETDDAAAAVLGRLLGELNLIRGRYAEAQDVWTRALGRTDEPLLAATLQRGLGRVHVRRDEMETAAEAYRRAEELLGEPDESSDQAHWHVWLELKLAEAQYHYWRADNASLEQAVDGLRPDVERHGTPQQRAEFSHVVMQNAFRRERYVLSQATEELARASFAAGVEAGQLDVHFLLGFALLWRGRLEEADEELRVGRDEARRVGDVLTETRCLVYRTVIRRKLGDVECVRSLVAEVDELEDTYGYGGLAAANRAWLALRDGDPAGAERWGAVAMAAWEAMARSGPTVFQWSGRFPLLAVDVERGRLDSAASHATAMLDERQQPLPDEVQAALRAALERPTTDAFAAAVEVARAGGYT
jgi:predicted ATPase/class 3 adenylate cyclase